MRTVEVFVECEVIEARVLIGLPSDLSVFEHFVLRAINAGVTSIAQLVNHLEVSHRILVDTLGDLWLAEHVILDATGHEEQLSLSSKARALLDTDSLSQIGCVYQTQEKRHLLFDTLIGRLLPMRASKWLASGEDRGLRVPRDANDPQYKDLQQSVLIRGIDEDLRKREGGPISAGVTSGRTRLRVIDAYVPPNQAPSRPRFVPLIVQITMDELFGLQVQVTDQRLSERERQTATGRLQRLIDERPNTQFVRTLAGQAPSAPLVEPAPLSASVAELQNRVSTLASSAPGTRQSQHDRIRAEFDMLSARIAGAAAREVAGDVIDGPDDHIRAIRALIDDADTQLILAGPWIAFSGIDRFMPDLGRAVERGVQLVILWGIGAEDTLEPAAVNAIENLQRKVGHHRVLVKVRTPARIHAKIVVCDDRAAIVTSHNFLRSGGRREIGVLVRAVEGRRCEAVEDLLAWSAEVFPDFDLAQAIVRSPESFGPFAEWPAATTIPVPRYTPALDTAAVSSPAGTAWALSWAAAMRDAQRLVADLGLSARTVRDAEHQTLMRSALISCQRRLLITSDQLSGAVLDSEWLALIESCLLRGVDILLVYRRSRPDAHDALACIEQMSAKYCTSPGRLVARCDETNHAKVLVWDDQSVVGSFNFLSFPGHYSGRGRLKDRGEISAHLVGSTFADDLLERFDFHGSPASVEPVVAESAQPLGLDLDLARQLLERFDDTGRLSSHDIAAVATAGSSPFAVLEVLANIRASEEVLERTCAAVLAADTVIEAEAWWVRLLHFVWQRGDFAAAHPIRLEIRSSAVRPRETTTAVAASLGGQALPDVLTDVVLRGGLSASETAAFLLVAAVELLREGDADVADILSVLTGEVVGPLVALGVIVEKYYRTVGLPLPAAEVQAGAVKRRQELDLEDSWLQLDGSLERMRRYSPGYLSGKAAQSHLFARGGRFAVLAHAATLRDIEAVSIWHSAEASVDVEQWTDRVTMEAGVRPIEGGRRMPFVTRVSQVFAAAAEVIVAAASLRSVAAPFQHPMLWECVAELRATIPDVRDSVSAIDAPERVLAQDALDMLGRLIGDRPND